jgi:hypothetical protein
VLWRRHRSRPWHLEFDWFVAAGAFFGSLLGVSVGYALIYPDPFDLGCPPGSHYPIGLWHRDPLVVPSD